VVARGYKFDVDRKEFEKTHSGQAWSPQDMILEEFYTSIKGKQVFSEHMGS
jgi:hypothetical protein